MPSNYDRLFGYDWNPDARDAYLDSLPSGSRMFDSSGRSIEGTGRGQVRLLHKCIEKVTGREWVPSRQTIGDCVSHGFAHGVMALMAAEICAGERERWGGSVATEPIYAAARVEIGGGQLSGDGCYGGWAAKAVQQFGTVVRGKYGRIDLTEYSGSVAKSWGRRGNGCPDSLEPHMQEHTVRSASLVTSYKEARDAIFNGYPVPVCSGQGFTSTRDSDGFAKPRGSWSHCMCFIGVDDDSKRKGLLCLNSWGPSWIRGPRRHGQPRGSFWVDADVADRMLNRRSDSYALSGFDGYPAKAIDYSEMF